RPRLDGPAIDDDYRALDRFDPTAVETTQRHRPVRHHLRIELDVGVGGRCGRNVLYGELDGSKFLGPAPLEVVDSVQPGFAELVPRAPGDRPPDRRDRATQPTAMSVPPASLTPDGGHAGTRRLIALHEN